MELGKRKSSKLLRFADPGIGIYDYRRFLATLDELQSLDLICPVCTDVVQNAVQRTECGHVFCRACIATSASPCPICRNPSVEISPIKSVERAVNRMQVNMGA